jgi:membrane associated rhomboid family serine protease
MIPISDDTPSRRTPVVTWGLILACVAAYLWELSLGRDMAAALDAFGFTPASLLPGEPFGTGEAQLSPAITILTAMFLHGSLLHIGGNMLYLWIFGRSVEDATGHLRFLLFYLLCGIAAALTLAWMDPSSHLPMVGASGAISGVLAAYVLIFPRARVTVIVPLGIIFYPFTVTAVWVVGFWFVMQVFSAAATPAGQPGVAWWAHVGGFVVGLLLTPLFKNSDFPLFGRLRRRGPWG